MDESYELPLDSNEELIEKQQIVAQNLIARDARALGSIESVVSYEIYPRIANHGITKVAWDTLK